MLGATADLVHCAHAPGRFRAVGEWYADFEQTSDAEVDELLARAHGSAPIVHDAGRPG